MSPRTINVAIVEDHLLVRDGLVRLISTKKGLTVVGSAGSLKEAFLLRERTDPDVVVADLSLDDGSALELVRPTRKAHPGTRFLITTGFCNEFSATDAFDAGLTGFILKVQSTPDLFAAIERVASGGVYLSSLVHIPSRRRGARRAGTGPLGPLSRREHQIFHLVVLGGNSRDIADQLSISIKTVETHRTSINQKLGVTNTASLVRFAVAHGIAIHPVTRTG